MGAPALVCLSGPPRAQGRQHAAAIPSPARAHLLRLVQAEQPSRATADLLDAARELTPELVETLQGLAEGLNVAFADFWAYTARGYVDARRAEGCSVAARGGVAPLLGKNRDFALAHLPLQTLLATWPPSGHPWVSVGSLGSPGVYSSGMNAMGLALADTAVAARVSSPGALRYALMQHVLERCADVPGAIALLTGKPAAIGGTVTLADASGRVGCVEMAYGRAAVRGPTASGWVTATNHFRHPNLRRANIYPRLSPDGASSAARTLRLRQVATARTASDLLCELATHAGPEDSLCRHQYGPGRDRGTLASVVYAPRSVTSLVRLGTPCAAETWSVEWRGGEWAVNAC